MKRFLSILAGCTLLWSTAQASVTDVKWGVDAEKNLRLVVDLTEPADFVANVENQTLVIKVKTALDGESRTLDVASEFAKSMSVKAAGAETIIRLPLTQVIAKEDIKNFTLKQDPVTKRPGRIVFDVLKKQAVPVISSGTSAKVEPPKAVVEQVKVVAPSEPVQPVMKEPKITVGSGAPSVKEGDAVRTSQNVNPKLIPASVLSSKGVQLADPKQIAKIPEIKRTQAGITKSSGTGMGNASGQGSAPAQVKVKMTPAKTGNAPGTGSATPNVTAMQKPKVTVGSSPLNRDEIQARAAQRGKDEVADIIGRNKTATSSVAVKAGSGAGASEAKKNVSAAVSAVSKVLPVGSGEEKPKKEKEVKKNKKGEYRTGGGIKGKVITIDPGHGGSDPGAVSKKGTYEKNITLSMARKLKSDLEDLGATVYLTRNADVDVAGKNADDAEELQARVNVAENHGSDLFISLHINASVNKKATGISTYYYAKTKYDGKLANCIHKQLTSNFGLNDMGVRQANFYVTKRCYMPAVLMELGFITNAKEEKTIKGNWFQNKAMDLVAKGIRDYFK